MRGRTEFIFVAVGSDINVNHVKVPDELAAGATSLRIETGRSFIPCGDRGAVAAAPGLLLPIGS